MESSKTRVRLFRGSPPDMYTWLKESWLTWSFKPFSELPIYRRMQPETQKPW